MAKKIMDVSGATPEEPSQDPKRKPVHTIRVEDVNCSVWAREVLVRGEPKTFLGYTFERSYKDRDGSWRYTKTYDGDSLGKLSDVVRQAAEFHRMRQQDAAGH